MNYCDVLTQSYPMNYCDVLTQSYPIRNLCTTAWLCVIWAVDRASWCNSQINHATDHPAPVQHQSFSFSIIIPLYPSIHPSVRPTILSSMYQNRTIYSYVWIMADICYWSCTYIEHFLSSCLFWLTVLLGMRDFKLPLPSRWDLSSSGILGSVEW